jgi:hypothetical protein
MKLSIIAGIAAIAATAPAAAAHLDNLDTPYSSRGACESAVAGFNSDVRGALLDQFPAFFDSEGDVSSFLTRAFPCQFDQENGNWYIQDHRLEVLTSDWYQQRH